MGDNDHGLIFDMQRFCSHDGPGIRTTVFLKGCPLRCRWCHNPESLASRPELLVRQGRCIGCERCRQACPQELSGACQSCGACAAACPTGARSIAGQRLSVSELVTKVKRDRIFFDESGGGVTFSGGEPLAQSGFLLQALAALQEQELHTTVDTSGLGCDQATLTAVARTTDLFLFDLKHADNNTHRRLTGVSNHEILANLATLGRLRAQIWIRVPVVPGLTDSDQNLRAIAEIAAATPGVELVCLLPFHQTGKALRLGQEEQLEGVTPPSPERMQELVALVESTGIPVRVGG